MARLIPAILSPLLRRQVTQSEEPSFRPGEYITRYEHQRHDDEKPNPELTLINEIMLLKILIIQQIRRIAGDVPLLLKVSYCVFSTGYIRPDTSNHIFQALNDILFDLIKVRHGIITATLRK